jgi:hypothetical protein
MVAEPILKYSGDGCLERAMARSTPAIEKPRRNLSCRILPSPAVVPPTGYQNDKQARFFAQARLFIVRGTGWSTG